MEKKNTSILIAKIIVLLLCAVNVVSSVMSFAGNKNISVLFSVIVNCLTLYYMFVAYKKPHGNLLRYLFILVAFEAIFDFWYNFTRNARLQDIFDLLLLLEIGIVSYVSGRLNKYKENIVLLVIALIALLVCGIYASVVLSSVLNITSTIKKFVPFDKFTILSALFVSYIARYKEHIEAGIEEDKK